MSLGPWVDSQTRAKCYVGGASTGLFRMETSFDNGENQHTLYVVTFFGFAFALHFPKRITEWLRGDP